MVWKVMGGIELLGSMLIRLYVSAREREGGEGKERDILGLSRGNTDDSKQAGQFPPAQHEK